MAALRGVVALRGNRVALGFAAPAGLFLGRDAQVDDRAVAQALGLGPCAARGRTARAHSVAPVVAITGRW